MPWAFWYNSAMKKQHNGLLLDDILEPVSSSLNEEAAQKRLTLKASFKVQARVTMHVVPKKHHGSNLMSNLAWACLECNLAKSSNLSRRDFVTARVVRLFNPSSQRWRHAHRTILNKRLKFFAQQHPCRLLFQG